MSADRYVAAIGGSVLDTRFVHSLPPNDRGSNWALKIRAGCAIITERHGTTEASLLAQDFEGVSAELKLSEVGTLLRTLLDQCRYRNVVVVGHGTDILLVEIQKTLDIDLG